VRICAKSASVFDTVSISAVESTSQQRVRQGRTTWANARFPHDRLQRAPQITGHPTRLPVLSHAGIPYLNSADRFRKTNSGIEENTPRARFNVKSRRSKSLKYLAICLRVRPKSNVKKLILLALLGCILPSGALYARFSSAGSPALPTASTTAASAFPSPSPVSNAQMATVATAAAQKMRYYAIWLSDLVGPHTDSVFLAITWYVVVAKIALAAMAILQFTLGFNVMHQVGAGLVTSFLAMGTAFAALPPAVCVEMELRLYRYGYP
jgi:hypothetical protein